MSQISALAARSAYTASELVTPRGTACWRRACSSAFDVKALPLQYCRSAAGFQSCGAMDCGAYALVGAAAAQIAGHRGVDVGIRRLRGVRQQGRRRHDLAGLTIAALRHVQLDPGLLYRMAAIGRQTLDGGHAPRADGVHTRDARVDWLPVQVYGARTAQGHAAAELGAGQAQRVAQHPQQRRVGIDIDFGVLAVDAELDHCTPCTGASREISAPLELARAHRARHPYYTAGRERRAPFAALPGQASCEGAADPLQCLAATSDAKASALSQLPTGATAAAAITTEVVIIGAGPCGLFQLKHLEQPAGTCANDDDLGGDRGCGGGTGWKLA